MPYITGPGNEVEILSNEEAEMLLNVLGVYQEADEWLIRLLNSFGFYRKRDKMMTPHDLIMETVAECNNTSFGDGTYAAGVLQGEKINPSFLREGEPQNLDAYLELVRSKSWIPEFVQILYEKWKQNSEFSPLDAAHFLDMEIVNFNTTLVCSEHFFRQYPKHFNRLEMTIERETTKQ